MVASSHHHRWDRADRDHPKVNRFSPDYPAVACPAEPRTPARRRQRGPGIAEPPVGERSSACIPSRPAVWPRTRSRLLLSRSGVPLRRRDAVSLPPGKLRHSVHGVSRVFGANEADYDPPGVKTHQRGLPAQTLDESPRGRLVQRRPSCPRRGLQLTTEPRGGGRSATRGARRSARI